MARNLIDKFVFSITKKPKHYVEVKNPPKTAKEKKSAKASSAQIEEKIENIEDK